MRIRRRKFMQLWINRGSAFVAAGSDLWWEVVLGLYAQAVLAGAELFFDSAYITRISNVKSLAICFQA